MKFEFIGYNPRMFDKVDPKAGKTPSTPTETKAPEIRPEAKPVTATESVVPHVERSPDKFNISSRVFPYTEMAERQSVAALVIRVAERMIQDRRPESMEQRERPKEREAHGDHDTRRAEGRGAHAKRPGIAEENPETAAAIKRAHGALGASDADVALKASKFGGKERALTPFEKTLVERFEEGMKQAKESTDGQFHFLKKSAGEWTGFFEKFLSRTMQKVVNWDDVQGLLFRGLLQEKGASQKGVMISDVMTAMGIDKFARISVAMSKAQQLAMATPGAMLTKEALQGAVLGDQLQYLALNPQLGEEGAARFSQAASRGMFASQQLENRVAEHLGIVTDFRGAGMPGAEHDAEVKRAAAARRRRGVWSNLFGGDDISGEGSVFVPWWSWNREERTGFRRWFVVVFGSVIFVLLFFLLIALIRALHS